MSEPINLFEKYLQLELQKFMQSQITTPVFVGEDNSIVVLPRVIINATGGPEAVFRSGIYQNTVEILTKVNLDGGAGEETPEFSRILFGQVLDVLQKIDLREQLMQSGNLFLSAPTGIVLGNQRSLEIDTEKRAWVRAVECDFFGFSTAES